MTLPAEYNSISMGQVRTELNKSSGPISLNDDDVRILFQVSRTSGTINSLHNGHGKSNIMPPQNVVLSAITQTSVTVSWKAYESLVVDGQVDNYFVQVFDLNNTEVYNSGLLAKTVSSNNVTTGISACSDHSLDHNYVVMVNAKNVSAVKTTSKNLLTLENVPLAPTGVIATTTGTTSIRISGAATYATSYNIYKDGSLTPFEVNLLPYTDTVALYTEHSYIVEGKSTGGLGPKSSSVTAKSWPNQPIAAVFTTVSTVNSITVNWVLSASVVNNYRLIIATTGGVEKFNQLVSNTTTSQLVDTGLTANTEYVVTLYTINNWTIDNTSVTTVANVWTTTVAPANKPTVAGVVARPAGETQLTVSWTEVVTGASKYNLKRYDVTTPANAVVDILNKTSPFTDTGLISYNDYQYTLLAENLGGPSAESPKSDVQRTLPGPAKVVTSFEVTVANTTDVTAKATWVKAEGQVTKYTVNLKQGASTLESKDIAGTAVEATLGQSPFTTTLTQNTSYAVSVTTTNENNSITTADATFKTRFTAPSPPSVTDPAVSKTQLTISWPSVADATGYQLIRKTDLTEVMLSVSTTINSTVTYTDTGLSSYVQYAYKLSIVNSTGPSVYSGQSNVVRTLPGDPTKVTNISMTVVTTNSARINWTAATGQVTKYSVTVVETSSGVSKYSNASVSSSSTYVDTGAVLSVGKAHTVTITTFNESGNISETASLTTVLDAPSAPVITTPATAQTSLSISWNSVSGATSHKLKRYTSAGNTSLPVNSSPYADSGLDAKTEYWYTLIATNAGGDSAESPISNKVKTLANKVAAPTTVTGTVTGSTTISVSWSSVTDADSYIVYRYPGNTSLGTQTSPYTAASLTQNTEYQFAVSSVTTGGESSQSTASSAVTTWYTKPNAPTSVYVSDSGKTQTQFSVFWTAPTTPPPVDFYKAEATASGKTTRSSTVAATSTDTIITGLDADTTYTVIVYSINNNSEKGVSSSTTGTTLPNAPAKPAKPTTASVLYNSITVNWTAVAISTGYDISRKVGTGAATVVKTDATGTTWTDSDISPSTDYIYYITAKNSGGSSPISDGSDKVTTPIAPPGAPSITSTSKTYTSITVNWSAPTTGGEVTTYRAYAVSPTNVETSSDATTSTSATIPGTSQSNLLANTAYTIRVRASNTSGYADSTTTSVSTNAYTVPSAPTIGTASYTGTDDTGVLAVVNWTASTSDGGSAITGYKIASSNGETATAASDKTTVNITVAAGVECTFTVKAVNGVGDSAASAASNKVCAIRSPTLTAPTLTASGNQLNIAIAARDGATDWQIQWTNDATWRLINVNGTWNQYATKTSETTLPVSSTTNWYIVAYQKRTINGTVYYSGPAYAHGGIKVTPVSNSNLTSDTTINYVIPGGTVTLIAAGGGGGGGGAAGVTSLVAGGNGGKTYAAGSTHTLPAGTRSIGIAVGKGGEGGQNKVTYLNSAYGNPGPGYAQGGWGGKVGQASTASGTGGNGGGSSGVWVLDTSGSWIADLMICGGGGGGGGGVGGTTGSSSATVLTVITDNAVAQAQGSDGFESAVATSTSGGGGGGGAGGGTGGATAQSAGVGGKYWRNTTTATAWTAPTTTSSMVAGGTGGPSNSTVGSKAGNGSNGFVQISYTTYEPVWLGLGQV